MISGADFSAIGLCSHAFDVLLYTPLRLSCYLCSAIERTVEIGDGAERGRDVEVGRAAATVDIDELKREE